MAGPEACYLIKICADRECRKYAGMQGEEILCEKKEDLGRAASTLTDHYLDDLYAGIGP